MTIGEIRQRANKKMSADDYRSMSVSDIAQIRMDVKRLLKMLDAFRAQQEQNEPLTLEELRKMYGNVVWCIDTDGTHPGLLCYVECVLDYGKDAHIWLLDNEGNAGRYNVRNMLELGARFYRRKPETAGID